MEFSIRDATREDGEQVGFVHYISWRESYLDLMPKEFLNQIKLEDRINRAQNDWQNTCVAICDDKIVGFIKYLNEARDLTSIKPSSEIVALYVLKDYQKRGIGYALIKEVINRVKNNQIVLFVLEGNIKARAFYQKVGFIETSHKITMPVLRGQYKLEEIEMIFEK